MTQITTTHTPVSAPECALPFGLCPIEERCKLPVFEEFLFSGHVTYQIWSWQPEVMATSNRRNMTKNQPQDTKGACDMTVRSIPSNQFVDKGLPPVKWMSRTWHTRVIKPFRPNCRLGARGFLCAVSGILAERKKHLIPRVAQLMLVHQIIQIFFTDNDILLTTTTGLIAQSSIANQGTAFVICMWYAHSHCCDKIVFA